MLKKEDEEEVKVDPKAKGKVDPKTAKKPIVEEEKEEEGKNKIIYEVGKEGNYIEFDLVIVY